MSNWGLEERIRGFFGERGWFNIRGVDLKFGFYFILNFFSFFSFFSLEWVDIDVSAQLENRLLERCVCLERIGIRVGIHT